MGGKRVEPSERKEAMTIHIKAKYIQEIRKIKGYNVIIEKLIADYLAQNKDAE